MSICLKARIKSRDNKHLGNKHADFFLKGLKTKFKMSLVLSFVLKKKNWRYTPNFITIKILFSIFN